MCFSEQLPKERGDMTDKHNEKTGSFFEEAAFPLQQKVASETLIY
jgi:hypothetical protein